MLRLRLKDVKEALKDGAVDVTVSGEVNEPYKVTGVSVGMYGMNGATLLGESGQVYVITKRTSNLFKLV